MRTNFYFKIGAGYLFEVSLDMFLNNPPDYAADAIVEIQERIEELKKAVIWNAVYFTARRNKVAGNVLAESPEARPLFNGTPPRFYYLPVKFQVVLAFDVGSAKRNIKLSVDSKEMFGGSMARSYATMRELLAKLDEIKGMAAPALASALWIAGRKEHALAVAIAGGVIEQLEKEYENPAEEAPIPLAQIYEYYKEKALA